LAAFEAAKKAATKERKATATPCPLVNPTTEDAERLQAIWNANKYHFSNEPQSVVAITQAQYSEGLKNGACETAEIVGGGRQPSSSYNAVNLPTLAKVRSYRGRVVILTDKPQTTFAPAVWVDPRPALLLELEPHAEEIEKAGRISWTTDWSDETRALLTRAQQVGIFTISSMTQFGLTEKGREWVKAINARRAPAEVSA
jgi:hypothetical protein